MQVLNLIEKRVILKEYEYSTQSIKKGFNNRTIYVNLSNNLIKEKIITETVKEKFVGGKGLALKLLWDATNSQTRWDSPENEIIISPGPIAGVSEYSGTGKSVVITISPQTDIVIDSNAGGRFGSFLKFSGFDAIELQGKAKNDVILFIDSLKGSIRIIEASHMAVNSHQLSKDLVEMFADDNEDKNNIAIVSAGIAADNTLLGLLNFSYWDSNRKVCRMKQAGRGGIGSVFRNKKIKAIVCKVEKQNINPNNVANLELIIEKGKSIENHLEKHGEQQCEMRTKGTAHLIDVMNDYDLLPNRNFKYGSHKDIYKIRSELWKNKFTQGLPDECSVGCALSCSKAIDGFELKTGPYKGHTVTIDGPEYESAAALGTNCDIFDIEHIAECNFYCDTYGICTITFGTITAFLMECYENGILNKERTGGLELTWGNKDIVMEMLHQMASGNGFGKTAGIGIKKLKKKFADKKWGDKKFLQDIGMENKGLEYSQYISKESLAQQGGYAMTNKGPQHDEAWLIFMDSVNNQIPTFEDKAEALFYFPIFRTWFGLMGLCIFPWSNVEQENNSNTSEASTIPENIENYVKLFNAVTGKNINKKELLFQSERIYNFQRIFNIRQGHGLRANDSQPYRAAGPVTIDEYKSREERYDKQMIEFIGINPENKSIQEKIEITRKYRETQYEHLIDAVYKRRGWTKNGVPTIEKLKELDIALPELIEVVQKHF